MDSSDEDVDNAVSAIEIKPSAGFQQSEAQASGEQMPLDESEIREIFPTPPPALTSGDLRVEAGGAQFEEIDISDLIFWGRKSKKSTE